MVDVNFIKVQTILRCRFCFRYRAITTLSSKYILLGTAGRRWKSDNWSCRFVDDKRAENVAKMILQTRKYKDSLIIETRAGHGVLTNAMLKSRQNIKRYVATEESDDYLISLKALQEKIGKERLLVEKVRHKFIHVTEYHTIEENILKSHYKEYETVTFIGTLPMNYEKSAVFDLLHKLEDKEGILNRITSEFFFFVAPNVYKRLRAGEMKPRIKSYQTSLILHQFFHIDYITKVPLSSINLKSRTKFSAFYLNNEEITSDSAYLCHMIPKLDLIKSVYGVIKFDKYFMNLPGNTRIIPAIEAVFPGSGLYLIQYGISMVDRIKDITPQQYLHIYMDMSSWTGYDDSVIKYIIESGQDISKQDSVDIPNVHGLHEDQDSVLDHIEDHDAVLELNEDQDFVLKHYEDKD